MELKDHLSENSGVKYGTYIVLMTNVIHAEMIHLSSDLNSTMQSIVHVIVRGPGYDLSFGAICQGILV